MSVDRAGLLAALADYDDDVVEAVGALIPAIAEMRKGGLISVVTFGRFHEAGLPVSVVIQSRPGRRERERVEASVISGQTVQLALDLDARRTA
jgi:hypothetical protein